MRCTRCRASMKEQKRSFHKQRKWVCPKCGLAKFQQIKPPRDLDHKDRDR